MGLRVIEDYRIMTQSTGDWVYQVIWVIELFDAKPKNRRLLETFAGTQHR